MPIRTPSENNLLRHQAMLERSLRDFRAGKKADHLAEDELSTLIAGLGGRLLAVRAGLAAMGYDLENS